MYSDPFGLTAMVETSITSDSGSRAGSAFASGTIGYACGYLEAWYNHDPNPALKATAEAVIGATVGAVLGRGIGYLPGMYQLTIGIAFAIQAVTSGEDYVIKGLRGACLIAEFATGGGFRNVKHAFDDVNLPKSLDDWGRAIKRFLVDESGSLPIGPNAATNKKAIVLGEGMGAVQDAAKGLQSQGRNAKWYQAWSKNFPANRPLNPKELQSALRRNERWIRSKVNDGNEFYDLGVDPTRSVRSPFYALEQRIIREARAAGRDVRIIPIPRSN